MNKYVDKFELFLIEPYGQIFNLDVQNGYCCYFVDNDFNINRVHEYNNDGYWYPGECYIKVEKEYDIDIIELERINRYLKYIEATKNSKAAQRKVDAIAEESKNKWWTENKCRFIK